MKRPALSIETARLFMRPFEPGDADNLHRVFVDADVRRFLLDDQVVSRDWVEEEIAASIARFETRSAGLFSVSLKNDQTMIGFCGFRPFFEPPQLQLLYGLLPAYWSRGLATEAARAMIEFGFKAVGFDRITASEHLGHVFGGGREMFQCRLSVWAGPGADRRLGRLGQCTVCLVWR